METVLRDIRYAFRSLAKRPGFTAIALIALMLGIGANTAIFSIVNGVLLHPLPYKDPEQLVSIWETQASQEHSNFSPAEFLDYQAQNQSFSGMAAYRLMAFTLTGAGEPEQVGGLIVTANFFSLLGVEPQQGRALQAEDGKPGAPRVAVISYSYWQNRFASDANVIGKAIALSGEPVTIVGVMAPNFQDDTYQIWVNPHRVVPDWQLHSEVDLTTLRKTGYLRAFARLKPGVTPAQAQADLNGIAARLEQQYPQTTGTGVGLSSLYEQVVGNVKPVLFILFGAVALVLLIACANVTSLMLARSLDRQREISIRMALGASRWQIVRQLLVESVLLTLAGGAGGGLLAAWGVHLFVVSKPADLPRLDAIALDYRVLMFTLLVSIVTGVLFGLVPALTASNPKLNSAFKETSLTTTTIAGRLRLRQALVVAEMALAFVVLIGAGLLVNSFSRLLAVKPGFDPNNLTTMRMSLRDARYSNTTALARFVKGLDARLSSIPGVQGVGISDDLPVLQTDSTTRIAVDGRADNLADQTPVGLHVINERYFEAMGTRLIKGRSFTERDNADAPSVFVINETMARHFWPNEEPLGKRIRYNSKGPFGEVVGVVEDIKYDGLHSVDSSHVYEPYQQNSWPFLTIAIRSQLDRAALMSATQREIQALDPNLPVSSVRTMAEVMGESLARRRLVLTLFSLFAGLALLLATIGIYGVLASSVAQRTRELGIRIALGATSRGVLRLVIGNGVKLVVLGIAIGMAGAIASHRLFADLLFGVSATDPLTFTLIALLLTGVAVVASYLPARRATKVDPLIALRSE